MVESLSLEIIFFSVLAGLGIFMMGVILYLRKQVMIARLGLSKRQTLASQIGRNNAMGQMYEVLGKFGLLTEFDYLMFPSATSSQASIDVIGILKETKKLVWLELKKKGAVLRKGERLIKEIIDLKNVEYWVVDVELPDGFDMKKRSTKNNSTDVMN